MCSAIRRRIWSDRYDALRATGAEVAKLAIQVSTLKETLPLFDLGREAPDEPGRGHVLIAMGNQGVPTRVLAARLRNRWTYAGDGVAPGQMPAVTTAAGLPVPADRAGRRALRGRRQSRSSTRDRRSCTTPALRRWD